MARKRSRKDLRGVDRESPEYWEELLKRDGLTMDAGRSKRISYVGGTADVDMIHGLIETDSGRVINKSED